MEIFENIKLSFDNNLRACGWYFTFGKDKYTHGFEVKNGLTTDIQIKVIENMLTTMKRVCADNII